MGPAGSLNVTRTPITGRKISRDRGLFCVLAQTIYQAACKQQAPYSSLYQRTRKSNGLRGHEFPPTSRPSSILMASNNAWNHKSQELSSRYYIAQPTINPLLLKGRPNTLQAAQGKLTVSIGDNQKVIRIHPDDHTNSDSLAGAFDNKIECQHALSIDFSYNDLFAVDTTTGYTKNCHP